LFARIHGRKRGKKKYGRPLTWVPQISEREKITRVIGERKMNGGTGTIGISQSPEETVCPKTTGPFA